MHEIDFFSLQKHAGEYETWPTKTELYRDGKPTGTKISGFCIGAQYQHKHGFLIVTDWDCPFEEAQTFTYLSATLEIISEETYGAALVSILLESHESLDDLSAVFHCDGGLDIIIKIESDKTMILKTYDSVTGKEWPGKE